MSETVAGALAQRIETLFREHIDAVYNVAYRVVWNRSDAEDVVQATFIKAFTRLDQLDDSGRLRPWLLQISYREALTVLRRRRDVPTDPMELPDTPRSTDSPEDAVISNDIAGLIGQALRRLGDDERLAVVLRDVEELPMREVAEVLDISLSAAKMRVHRGRQSLRHLLEAMEVR